MVSEFFLDVIFKFVSGFLDLLPEISWSVDTSAFSYFTDIISVVSYMLPMGTVNVIINLIIALTVFRIVISVLKSIWDILPIV